MIEEEERKKERKKEEERCGEGERCKKLESIPSD